MEFNLWSFILDNLDSAGAIGGYVSLSIIGFSIISFVTKKRLNYAASSIGPKWTHPIIGSFFGAIPGCGATIVVASLYKNKKISFGGLFATFISTLGEGSFVLLGASAEASAESNLKAYAIITIFGLITGIVFGYLSDILGFRTSLRDNHHNDIQEDNLQIKNIKPSITKFIENVGLYSIILMAIILAPTSIMALWGGDIEAISSFISLVSIVLTISCMIFYGFSRFFYKQHDCYGDIVDFKSTMLHAVLDVAMVVTYVFIGLFLANYIIDILVGVKVFYSWMSSSGYIVVFLAALIGLMPGCGGMIVVAVAFIKIHNFPIAALIAAAIATSGDGIFPLLASNKKDGFIISGLGFLIALCLGYITLYLGF